MEKSCESCFRCGCLCHHCCLLQCVERCPSWAPQIQPPGGTGTLAMLQFRIQTSSVNAVLRWVCLFLEQRQLRQDEEKRPPTRPFRRVDSRVVSLLLPSSNR